MKADAVNTTNSNTSDAFLPSSSPARITDDVVPTLPLPSIPSSSPRIIVPAPRQSLWGAIFRMVVIEWVNDFLFATDGTTHASMLLSPCQETNSQLMTSSATQLTAVPGMAVDSHWLLFPVYSVAGVSVGLVVQEEISTGNIPRLMRYVRCDDTGETLCVNDAPDGELEVEYVCYSGTLSSTRMFCRFDSRLRDHLRSRVIDDSLVKSSLLHSMTLNERRASCGQCNSTTEENCVCKLGFTFRRARHPLDFPYTAANTLPILGDFRGFGSSMNFRGGTAFESSSVATELRTRSGGIVGTTERLQIWAARVCFEAAKPNPLMLEMPPSGTTDAMDEMVNGFLCDDENDTLKVPTKRQKVKKEKEDHEIDLNIDGTAWKIPMPLSVSTVKPEIGTSIPAPTNITPITTTPLLPAPVAMQRVPVVPVPVLKASTSVTPNTNISPIPLLPLPLPVLPILNNGNVPQKRRWASIAPSATPTENVEQYTSAERRKIMKREAAARSNAKRRELVALQRKLAKAKAKIETLRKREEQLRRENRQLLRETKVG